MPKRKAAPLPKRKVKTASPPATVISPRAVISPPSWEDVMLILIDADVDTQDAVDIVGKGEQQHLLPAPPPSTSSPPSL